MIFLFLQRRKHSKSLKSFPGLVRGRPEIKWENVKCVVCGLAYTKCRTSGVLYWEIIHSVINSQRESRGGSSAYSEITSELGKVHSKPHPHTPGGRR